MFVSHIGLLCQAYIPLQACQAHYDNQGQASRQHSAMRERDLQRHFVQLKQQLSRKSPEGRTADVDANHNVIRSPYVMK